MVVAPNVRGSTGFGKKYQFLDNGDWGGGHIKDIINVAEYVKKLKFVNPERVYILGGSFGGFSVMSLITQYPKVFRAAVDIFGPIEMKSFVISWPPSVLPYWLSELGNDPRTDEDFNKKVSPIYHLDRISIPLQVHQGENDIRVPKAQSDLLVGKMVR
jgi:dipeptidyl aminopeptidase/acylaminoacyl peptidase